MKLVPIHVMSLFIYSFLYENDFNQITVIVFVYFILIIIWYKYNKICCYIPRTTYYILRTYCSIDHKHKMMMTIVLLDNCPPSPSVILVYCKRYLYIITVIIIIIVTIIIIIVVVVVGVDIEIP